MTDRDTQLVSACLNGDRSAFDGIYAAHAGRVKAFLLRSGFVDADSDDLTQEVFVRAHKSLKTFDAQRGAFRTWLGTITRNVARRHWARRVYAQDFDLTQAEEMFATHDNPGHSAQAAEEARFLREFVAALPADLRELVHLRYVEARTTRSIAEIAQTPEATVRLRLKEALAMLESGMRSKGLVT